MRIVFLILLFAQLSVAQRSPRHYLDALDIIGEPMIPNSLHAFMKEEFVEGVSLAGYAKTLDVLKDVLPNELKAFEDQASSRKGASLGPWYANTEHLARFVARATATESPQQVTFEFFTWDALRTRVLVSLNPNQKEDVEELSDRMVRNSRVIRISLKCSNQDAQSLNYLLQESLFRTYNIRGAAMTLFSPSIDKEGLGKYASDMVQAAAREFRELETSIVLDEKSDVWAVELTQNIKKRTWRQKRLELRKVIQEVLSVAKGRKIFLGYSIENLRWVDDNALRVMEFSRNVSDRTLIEKILQHLEQTVAKGDISGVKLSVDRERAPSQMIANMSAPVSQRARLCSFLGE